MKSLKTKNIFTMSILSVVICVAMLVGMTFAWFTDTASTNVNKIQAGDLDVALEMWDATANENQGGWVTAEGETLSFIKAAGNENEAVLWEPGAQYNLPKVRIVNKGDLALKYKVVFSAGSSNIELSKVLDVYMNGQPVQIGEKQATFKDVLTSTDADGFVHGVLDAGESSDEVTVSLKMQESAGNEYKKLSIDGIAVTVYATQDAVEYDSTSNGYDANAEFAAKVNNLSSVNAALGAGASKITINEDFTVYSGDNDGWSALRFDTHKAPNLADKIVLEGSGTVTSDLFVVWGGTGADVTIKSGTYKTTGTTHLIYVNGGGKVTIEGGTFISGVTGEHMFNMKNDTAGGQIIIKGGLFNKDPRTQIASNDKWTGTKGIKVEDGYKVQEKIIDGATWYQVVPE